MKAAKWFAPREIRVVDVAKPVPKPNEALIRVECVGICGSDLHYYADGGIGSSRLTEPVILGHEYAGVVEAVGDGEDKSLIGKRVAVEPGIPCLDCEFCRTGYYNVCRNMVFPGGPGCDGALCEYMIALARFCFPIPDNITTAEAAMLEPLAVALHSIELARLRPGDTAAVLGLGPIGLLTARVAKFAGAGFVYGTDLLDYRVEAGNQFGVDLAFNAGKADTAETIMKETNGRGVDIVFDAARSSETPAYACQVARPAGRCVFTGISGAESDPMPVSSARRKGLTVHWCRRFRHNYPQAISLVDSEKIDVKSLITHSFNLEQTQEAFELVYNNEGGVLKACINI